MSRLRLRRTALGGGSLQRVLEERLRALDRTQSIVEPSIFSDNSSRPAAENFTGHIIYVGGSTNQFQISDGKIWNVLNVGGGSTAPADATYITVQGETGLTKERVLAAGTALTLVDGGANGSLTVNHAAVASGDLHTEYLKSDGTRSLSGTLTLADAVNFILNIATGTKIGTAATQKLGFWNAAPVAQAASTGETAGFTAGVGTNVQDVSTFTGNVGSKAYTISDIVKALKNSGIMAAS